MNRVNAHTSGQWVRDAAQAYAAKQRAKQDARSLKETA